MAPQTPSINRAVHYVAQGGEHRAAIMTEVLDDTHVSLAIFEPTKLRFEQNVLLDDVDRTRGTWHWPEKVGG